MVTYCVGRMDRTWRFTVMREKSLKLPLVWLAMH